jgi:hypothetical protein
MDDLPPSRRVVAVSRHVLVATLWAGCMMAFLLVRVLVADGGYGMKVDQRRGVMVLLLILGAISILIAWGVGAAFAGSRGVDRGDGV